jgi:EAL domain-containing protein (putative c-di-GMP-specific phosphodiesterase class I)
MSPDQFIPLAEQSGLIIPLGLWVLEQALLALAAIDRRAATQCRAGANVFMSVNVSPRQLDTEATVEELVRTIERADIAPTKVKQEITEQALLSDPRRAMLSLAHLKATGA